jgi:hypothetical protein
MSLKKTYEDQRQSYEEAWRQALDAVYMLDDNLTKVYEGRARINSPIMKWKVQGIQSRIMKILFNNIPIGRIEPTLDSDVQEEFIDLWNKYIFEKQLNTINFMDSYRLFLKNCIIQGTAIAKIPQVYETSTVDFFPDDESTEDEIVIKDDTYFEPILLTEFYTDVNQYNLQNSLANIHSTAIRYEDLKKLEKRKVKNTYELIDPDTGEVSGYEEKEEEEGKYHNLDLIITNDDGYSAEQQTYIELLGFTRRQKSKIDKLMKESSKSGLVQIDECYGKYIIDGVEKEVICTIANGFVVIQLEESPYIHKRYPRPFISGKYEPIPNCFYGVSNVIAGLDLLRELNACRSQSRDANTQSIFPMTYIDKSKNINWDYQWRPNGIIEGIGSDGITSIINPSLANVNLNDSAIIQRDIDQLFSLSPVQEGTSDRSKIPHTKGATLSIIAQNDMPLNELIMIQTNEVLKPFIEMLYERNITFKTVDDLLTIYTEEELNSKGINQNLDMKQLYFNFNIKVLGNLELSNEIAHQNGYMNFLNYAQSVPPLAKRLDWKVAGEKLLSSFGIKDDGKDIFLDEETVMEAEKQMQEQQLQALQAQKFDRKERMIEELDMEKEKTKIKLESDMIKDANEVALEKATGQKLA